MTIFQQQERWVASEKLAAKRQELLLTITGGVDDTLAQIGCRKIDLSTWLHEPSDTIIHLCCVPRTHG